MPVLTVRLAQLSLPVVAGATVAIWKRQNNTTGATVPGAITYAFTDVAGEVAVTLNESAAGEVYEIRLIILGDVRLMATFVMPGIDAYLDTLELMATDDVPAPATPVVAGLSGVSNVGAGAQVFKGLALTVAELRTLVAGDNVTITTVGDTIVIAATGAGATGAAGTNGTNGTNGLTAFEIAQAEGFAGTLSQWLDSLRGDQGIQGETGNAGAAGQSAYALAVALGYIGTELDWILSLKGVKGDTGDTGAAGATGAAGTNGTNGTNGINGTNGSSAYQIAVTNGFIGTEAEWLTSLVGDSGLTPWDMSVETVICAYPLNETDANIIAAGFAGTPTLTVSSSMASYTMQSALAAEEIYVARGATLPSVPVNVDTKVMEWALVSEVLTGEAATYALKLRFGLIDKTTPANVVGVLEFELKGDGTKLLRLITDLGTSADVTLGAMPARVSMAFNSVAGTIAVRLDDVAQAFSASTYTATSDATLETRISENAGAPVAFLGKAFSVLQYTAAGDITGTHAAGAKDICGHIINDAAVPAGPNSVLVVSVAGDYQGESYAVGDILVLQGDGVTVEYVAQSSVKQFANLAAFPASGAGAALYIAADTGLLYRWDGAAYAPVGLQPVASMTLLGNNTGGSAVPTALAKGDVQTLLDIGWLLQSRSIAAPNATVPAHQIIPVGAEANIDLVLQPKGTGALLLDIPDNAVAGGNKRGSDAIDLQMVRSAATQVASSTRSICLGNYNSAIGADALAIGNGNKVASGGAVGKNNNNAAAYSGWLFGVSNTTNSSDSDTTILLGHSNAATSTGVKFGAGRSNTMQKLSYCYGASNVTTADGGYCFGFDNQSINNFNFLYGLSNVAQGTGGAVYVFGSNNTFPSGSPSLRAHVYGYNNKAAEATDAQVYGRNGYLTHANCTYFPQILVTTDKVSLRFEQHAKANTTDATPTVMSVDGAAATASNALFIRTYTTAKITGHVIARTAAGDYKVWKVDAVADKQGAGTLAIPTATPVTAEDASAGAAGWGLTFTVSGDLCVLTATGAAATTIKWFSILDVKEFGV